METVIDRIRATCRAKKIPVSKLERDLGFSNGYLNPKKAVSVSADRLFSIANYLGVSVDFLRTGIQEAKKEPATSEGSKLSEDDIKFALFGGSDEITDEMYEEVKRFAAYVRARELERKGGAND